MAEDKKNEIEIAVIEVTEEYCCAPLSLTYN